MMLVLALLLIACTGVSASDLNVTYVDVPNIVPLHQQEVEAQCGYVGNFTYLHWFKGGDEFFRYQPGFTPPTLYFPVHGIGTLKMLRCDHEVCKLKLGGLTQEATGTYTCRLDLDEENYKIATLGSHMEVHGPVYRKPLLGGLAEEYENGDMIQAYCRGVPRSEFRWYINGAEFEEFRGSSTFHKKSNRWLFKGDPPRAVVQCAEFRYGRLYGTSQQTVEWLSAGQLRKKKENVVENGSTVITGSLVLIGILPIMFVS